MAGANGLEVQTFVPGPVDITSVKETIRSASSLRALASVESRLAHEVINIPWQMMNKD